MFDLILVPLDGSKRAEAILPHVQALAGCLGSELVLLQVVEPVLLPYDPQGYLPELDSKNTEERLSEARSYLEGIAKHFRAEGMNVRCRIESGAVVDTILELALTLKADLVAMASHGRTGLARAFYGSVADGVLHKTSLPLLVVRSIE